MLFFFTFTEGGKKVEKMEEMVDTTFSKDFFPKFQAHLVQQRGSS